MLHEDPTKIQPEFYITLQNAGQGNAVIQEKVYDACSGKPLGTESWNTVELTARLSEQELHCRPEKIKLTKETRIVCTLNEGIEKTKGTYAAPLSIELSYGYMDRIVKNIEIKKITTKNI